MLCVSFSKYKDTVIMSAMFSSHSMNCLPCFAAIQTIISLSQQQSNFCVFLSVVNLKSQGKRNILFLKFPFGNGFLSVKFWFSVQRQYLFLSDGGGRINVPPMRRNRQECQQQNHINYCFPEDKCCARNISISKIW